MIRVVCRAALLASVLVLAACSSVPPRTDASAEFTAAGRLAARGEVQGRTVNESAHFRWRRSGELIDVELGSPLGDTQARLSVSPEETTLLLADGRSAVAPDAESLLTQLTGLALPVSYLRWWLEGELAPGPDAEELPAQGAERRFVQAGWQVTLFDVDPYPKRLTLSREGFEVRIAVSSWQ